MSRTPYQCLVMDTSGALAFCGPRDSVFTSSGVSDGRAQLRGVRSSLGVRNFRFGVAVVQTGDHHHVLRFDGEGPP